MVVHVPLQHCRPEAPPGKFVVFLWIRAEGTHAAVEAPQDAVARLFPKAQAPDNLLVGDVKAGGLKFLGRGFGHGYIYSVGSRNGAASPRDGCNFKSASTKASRLEKRRTAPRSSCAL